MVLSWTEFNFFNYEDHIKLAEIAMHEAKNIIDIDPKLTSKRGKELITLLKLFWNIDATNLLSAGY